MSKILVIGANGQLGSELTIALRKLYGNNNVIASDVRESTGDSDGPFEILNVLDKAALNSITDKYRIDQIYHLAAILSAKGESEPKLAWDLNMNSLLNVLEIAHQKSVKKVFWPSSIAVFGPNTPKHRTPQHTVMDPDTVYGISKLAGERWCEYYFLKYGVDVRSLRYPGLIGYKAKPGGGTTDYAVEIFQKALEEGYYESFISENTHLPMMYMEDAINATLQLMQTDRTKIQIRSSYNVSAMSFCPKDIAAEIQTYIPEFTITYKPDFRQVIADSWPDSIDDSCAKEQWDWQPAFDLPAMTKAILEGLKQRGRVKV